MMNTHKFFFLIITLSSSLSITHQTSYAQLGDIFKKGKNLIKQGKRNLRKATAPLLSKKVDANASVGAEYAGGLSGGTFTVNLGGSKGKVTLEYCTYEVHDNIWIDYEGKTVLDLKCPSTGGKVGSEVWMKKSFDIDGKSNKITVFVEGNCTGNTKGQNTKWLFKVVANVECVAIECKVCKENGNYAVFAKKPLYSGVYIESKQGDKNNTEVLHEHVFFCKDNRIVGNEGFGPEGKFTYTKAEIINKEKDTDKFVISNTQKYDSKKMKKALAILNKIPRFNKPDISFPTLSWPPRLSFVQGFGNSNIIPVWLPQKHTWKDGYRLIGNNCQDYSEELRRIYNTMNTLSSNTPVQENESWKCKSNKIRFKTKRIQKGKKRQKIKSCFCK